MRGSTLTMDGTACATPVQSLNHAVVQHRSVRCLKVLQQRACRLADDILCACGGKGHQLSVTPGHEAMLPRRATLSFVSWSPALRADCDSTRQGEDATARITALRSPASRASEASRSSEMLAAFLSGFGGGIRQRREQHERRRSMSCLGPQAVLG